MILSNSAVMKKEKEANISGLYELSRMVLPNAAFEDNTNLFIRKEETSLFFDGGLKECNIYKFNTYMNMFAPKKYRYYCDIGDIFLKADIEGDYILKVTGGSRHLAYGAADNLLINRKCKNKVEIKIPNCEKYESLFYEITEDKGNPVEIKGISWCTNRAPKRADKIAVIICTYKREEYINKNIALFEEFMSNNPELKGRLKMIIADNGRTLDISKSNDNIKIIPNINTGGAGGFTRGLLDVIEQNKNNAGFTRVLFMDDDIEINAESFYKTLIIADYLKDEFQNSFINGAMFDLYNKNMFFECLSTEKDFLWENHHEMLDAGEYKNVLAINNIEPGIFENGGRKAHSAWWYQSFPLDNNIENDLPVPIFFRGDDVEYGRRHKGRHHISMNGICVWHAPFYGRQYKVPDYFYTTRNMFMINALHSSNARKTSVKYFKKTMKHLLITYDYVSLELFKKALEEILKGSSAFKSGSENLCGELSAVTKKAEYTACFDNELTISNQADSLKIPKWRKLIWKLTHYGRYCPSFLFKKQETAVDFYPSAKKFMLVKEVKCYNIALHKYEIRKFDKSRLNYFEKEITKLIKNIDKNYDKLRADYSEAYKEFTTAEFWKKYLHLQGTL